MSNLTAAELAELESLRAENKALKEKKHIPLTLRVSAKGGVSLYGLGRFPVTFYKEQWLRLIEMVEKIKAFIVEHDKELRSKPADYKTVEPTVKK